MIAGTTAADFVHPALLYADDDGYLAGTVPFIRDGLAAGEPVAVAVPGRNLHLIREALGGDAEQVLMRDMTAVGRNPGRIIPTVLLAFANAHPERRVRIIGEPIWAGRNAIEYPACAQHEALINAAFAGRAATILCPYNTGLLEPAWLEDAHKTHPVMVDATQRFDSVQFGDPLAVAADFNRPLPEAPAEAATITIDPLALATARRFVAGYANRCGLAADRIAALTVAVTELATNAVEHGGGTGELTVWADDDALVCQVVDSGHLSDPLAGRIPVPADAPGGGRGLLLVHQLCDLVRVHTTPTRTTTRIHLYRRLPDVAAGGVPPR
jgi:anti-sigma regulatory factor (Ser/Thr protein kinase)